MLQSFLSKLLKKGNILFPNYSEKKYFLSKLFKKEIFYLQTIRNIGRENVVVSKTLFVHAAARGGTCAFTLRIVNTLTKNSSRDDRPSIST